MKGKESRLSLFRKAFHEAMRFGPDLAQKVVQLVDVAVVFPATRQLPSMRSMPLVGGEALQVALEVFHCGSAAGDHWAPLGATFFAAPQPMALSKPPPGREAAVGRRRAPSAAVGLRPLELKFA
eukprot:CAMPEP_0181439212 /NCGR_PEP_ID=MMETSP1110-20121109/22310_2 /TAXON_ID=174948 /ORGANISM="Symbiodinium sp., Strain CCMP421" /LENGTH=123 /DNA_ID=CAMNT_0023562927 /DNA_START=270 /DNA_END=639 /DNA_ORIENTATION=-